jgi:uncharacterized protein involved in outer membrane biogenesis
MKRKILIAAAAGAVVLILVVVGILLLVDVDSFRGFIETRAEEALDRDVRLGTLSMSFLPTFGLRVDDVAVAARPGDDQQDLLTLRSVRIGARLLPLLAKRLEVRSIVLDEPAVFLERDASGNWNFDLGAGEVPSEEAEGDDEPAATPELTIDSLRITGGRIGLRDASRSPEQPTEVSLSELELVLSNFSSRADFDVAVDSGRLSVKDPVIGPEAIALELRTIDLAVRDGGDQVELARLEVVVGDTSVALAGSVAAQPEGRRIDLDLEPTSIDVADISSLLASAAPHLGVSLTGDNPLGIQAGVHGVLAEGRMPEIGAQVTAEAVGIEGAALTQPVTDLHAVATLRGTTLSVEGLRMRAGDNDLAGSLQLGLQDRPSLSFALESQRADLGELLELLAPSEEEEDEAAVPPDPDSFLVRSVADGTLAVAEGSWTKLRFRDLDARLRMRSGTVALDPVSMKLYGGSFSGRLTSDLTTLPQSFEFAGEAKEIDVNPFLADQMGMSDILFGSFTGRVAGRGAGVEPETVIETLEGEGVAQIVDGQVGRLDVLRSIGQVAGVLGQQSLAKLGSDSVTGATRFSRLGGDFRIGGGTLVLDSVQLLSNAFDLAGTGTVDLLSSAIDGDFQILFSPELSSWMREESSRAAELFWDPSSDRVVLPVGLSGPLSEAGASVDWSAAAEGAARRTIERELSNFLGKAFGGSDDKKD